MQHPARIACQLHVDHLGVVVSNCSCSEFRDKPTAGRAHSRSTAPGQLGRGLWRVQLGVLDGSVLRYPARTLFVGIRRGLATRQVSRLRL